MSWLKVGRRNVELERPMYDHAVGTELETGMSIYALKPRFQNLLRPLVSYLAKAGITANQVTLGAALGSLVVGAAVALGAEHRWLFLAIPVWMLIRMALNAVDGMLARDFGQKSKLGAFLNEISDVMSDAALYAPFALVAPFSWPWMLVIIVLAITTEFAGVLGTSIGADRHYDGPMGKSDRAAVFGLLGAIIAFTAQLPGWFIWIMPVLVIFLILTIVRRVKSALAQVQDSDRQTHAQKSTPQ